MRSHHVHDRRRGLQANRVRIKHVQTVSRRQPKSIASACNVRPCIRVRSRQAHDRPHGLHANGVRIARMPTISHRRPMSRAIAFNARRCIRMKSDHEHERQHGLHVHRGCIQHVPTTFMCQPSCSHGNGVADAQACESKGDLAETAERRCPAATAPPGTPGMPSRDDERQTHHGSSAGSMQLHLIECGAISKTPGTRLGG